MSQATATVSIPPAIARPARPAAPTAATVQIAERVLRKYFRTPGQFVMGMVQSGLFLFMFRYVFGGAIRVGAVGYVGYLVPGYVATIVLFTGGGIAVGVAEDKAQGLTERLLSLPIARSALVTGRTLADFTTNGWSILFTAALGFAFGFRLPSSAADGLAALGLCLLYGLVFTVVFIVIGLFAPNAQAAQGMSMIAFVLAFISSTYVPPSSMPGWLQPFATYQPVTLIVNAVRSALTGGTHDLASAIYVPTRRRYMLLWQLAKTATVASSARSRPGHSIDRERARLPARDQGNRQTWAFGTPRAAVINTATELSRS